MSKLWIISILIILAATMVLASPITCYQESPVIDNQSGTDTGDCGLSYSGTSIVWTWPETSPLAGLVNETYIKPEGARNTSRIRFKAGYQGYLGNDEYVEIPASCWNYDPETITLILFTQYLGDPGGRSQISCWNGTLEGNIDYQEKIEQDTGASHNQWHLSGTGQEMTDGNWTTWVTYGGYPVCQWNRPSDYSFLEEGGMRDAIWETAIEWDVCVPDWICWNLTECQPDDLRYCNAVTDVNECGNEYSGNFSEFTQISCDYCTPEWDCTGWGTCINRNKACIAVEDTLNCSEEYTGNFTEFGTQACGGGGGGAWPEPEVNQTTYGSNGTYLALITPTPDSTGWWREILEWLMFQYQRLMTFIGRGMSG